MPKNINPSSSHIFLPSTLPCSVREYMCASIWKITIYLWVSLRVLQRATSSTTRELSTIISRLKVLWTIWNITMSFFHTDAARLSSRRRAALTARFIRSRAAWKNVCTHTIPICLWQHRRALRRFTMTSIII